MGWKAKTESSSVQLDSKFSKWVMGGLRILRGLGILCLNTGMKNTLVEQDSKFSKLKKNQALHSLHEFHGKKMFSAQRLSIITKWGMGKVADDIIRVPEDSYSKTFHCYCALFFRYEFAGSRFWQYFLEFNHNGELF